jgi:hypothetical protein
MFQRIEKLAFVLACAVGERILGEYCRRTSFKGGRIQTGVTNKIDV